MNVYGSRAQGRSLEEDRNLGVISVFQPTRLDQNLDRKELRTKTRDCAWFKTQSEKREDAGKEYKGAGRDVGGKPNGGKERRTFQEEGRGQFVQCK